MSAPTPIPGILDIAPYVGGDSKVEGLDQSIKLSSNESALGASPKAREAVRQLADELERYPDGGSNALREALAKAHGLDADRVITGNGSDEIIAVLTHAYVAPGDEVVCSEYGFLMYPISTMACGGKPVFAKDVDYTASVDNMLAAVGPRTRMLFVANPNNPTGTYLPASELRRLRDNLRPDILMVVDAAYAEFVSRNDYASGKELVDELDNVVMTRTFSKIYGLAALRLGWAYCPLHVAQVFHRVRGPFNVNAAAQRAGVAALADVAFTDKAKSHNDVWLPWLVAAFEEMGLQVLPSVGNFVTVRFDDRPGRSAEAANAFLKARGVIGRGLAGYKMPGWLRFTVGKDAENRGLVEAVAAYLKQADG
jgi:histidinol-phosphate aminotransferase